MAAIDGLSKIEEVYLYIIKCSQSNINFGHTLFNKILYFTDFDYYEQHETSITGDMYMRSPHGPTAKRFRDVINALKEKKLVKGFKMERSKDRVQTRYILVGEFEPVHLNQEELSEIDRNISRLEGMTAQQVSEYSHQDMPYKATKDSEIIDYDLVFYRNPIYSAVESKELEESL
ncbi:MAG: Panacea domain-containing protein [Thermoplasmatales archaeon]